MYWFYILLIIYYIIGLLTYSFLQIKKSNSDDTEINFESIKIINSNLESEF